MKDNFWSELPPTRFFCISTHRKMLTGCCIRHVVAERRCKTDRVFTDLRNSESYMSPLNGKKWSRARLTFNSKTNSNGPSHNLGAISLNSLKRWVLDRQRSKASWDWLNCCPARPKRFLKHGRGSGLILRTEVAAELIQEQPRKQEVLFR